MLVTDFDYELPKELIAQHRSGVFDTWLEQDKISCLPNHGATGSFPPARGEQGQRRY